MFQNPYETQANESINNIIAMFYPKMGKYSNIKVIESYVMIEDSDQSKFWKTVNNILKIIVSQLLSFF